MQLIDIDAIFSPVPIVPFSINIRPPSWCSPIKERQQIQGGRNWVGKVGICLPMFLRFYRVKTSKSFYFSITKIFLFTVAYPSENCFRPPWYHFCILWPLMASSGLQKYSHSLKTFFEVVIILNLTSPHKIWVLWALLFLQTFLL